MRIAELFEGLGISRGVSYTLPPSFVIPGIQNNDSYIQYRYLVALAVAGAPEEEMQNMSPDQWWGRDQSVICYAPEEEEKVKMANKMMGQKSVPLTKTPSSEFPGRQTQSPVRKFVDLD